MTGLYVHVPFCLSKCGYCAFYSTVPTQAAIDAYLDKLENELHTEVTGPAGVGIKTIFIGGGNPTAIGAGSLVRLLRMLRSAVSENSIEEWSIETNPETLTDETAAVLRDVPGLRLSMGLQRLRDDELAVLGRCGKVSTGRKAIERALSLTSRVGVDLILGVPGCSSLAPALADLVSGFPIEHVSAYFLTLEEGTPLEERVRKGLFPDPADVGPEELFEVGDVLAAAGFEHYEISNFARAGGRCRHNMNYWHSGEYIGLGPAAVGTRGGSRLSKPPDIASWLRGAAVETERLTDGDVLRETVMLRLRLVSDGLDLEWLADRFGSLSKTFVEAVNDQCAAGMLRMNGSNITLTRQGIAVANKVISALF